MMSVHNFERKQIAFVFTNRSEKLTICSFTDAGGNVKRQATCYIRVALFICGDFCLTSASLTAPKSSALPSYL